jgi:phenylacetate-CoA ligase
MRHLLHDIASRRVLIPALRGIRRYRRDSSSAAAHFHEGLAFRRGAAGWSDEQKREWMLQQLRRAVRAAADSPFYRERFAAAGFDPAAPFTAAEFAALPTLERSDLLDHGDAMRRRVVPATLTRRDATGGSSGRPVSYRSGPEERGWRESGGEYAMMRVGIPPGARRAFLWGHHLDPLARSARRDRIRDWIENIRWYDCLRLDAPTLEQHHRALQATRPACIIAYASALAALADFVLERGLKPAYPSRCCITGGEKLWPHQRDRVMRAFGRPVHERYGSREIGFIGFQVDPARSLAFEVDWANIYAEPAEGTVESDILVTKLHADAQPMIRYRIGDVGHFQQGATPGRPALLLEAVAGRRVDGLYRPDGGWFHGIGIPHLMKDLPIRDFQVVQGEDFTIDVYVVPASGYEMKHGMLVADTLRGNVGGVDVRVRQVAEIPRTAANKWRPVVSHVRPEAME